MRNIAILLAGLCSVALAQPLPPALEATPEVLDRERARIEDQRQREQLRFAAEEAACYQRFAVNDCLREVRARRRAVLEALRREEIELNDAQRRTRAAERLRRLGEGPAAAEAPGSSALPLPEPAAR